MIRREGFLEGPGGRRIYRCTWFPDAAPRAVVVIVHGLAEHSGRYGGVADLLVPRGYGVIGYDHPGHGRTAGRRACFRRFGDLTETLAMVLGQVRTEQPGTPIFLLGHSMGGLIAAARLADGEAGLAGAVLSAPSLMPPGPVPRVKGSVLKLCSALAPGLRVTRLDAETISRDPAVVSAYRADPLVYTGRISARSTSELLGAMRRLADGAARITLPILILQGGSDRMVDPNGARHLHDHVGSRDKTIKVYDGLYHEVFNDVGRERALADLAEWLDAHLDRGGSEPAARDTPPVAPPPSLGSK